VAVPWGLRKIFPTADESVVMKIKLVFILLFLLILSLGCVSQENAGAAATATSITTLPTVITTPTPSPLLEETVTIGRDTYRSWEFTLSIGRRYAVEMVTDGAPVDLLVLDQANYNKFSNAFYADSGAPWDQYVLFIPNVVQDRKEFKVSFGGKYRVIIENADFIPGGAVTTRDISVNVRLFDLG
jgi:hypothetical protein